MGSRAKSCQACPTGSRYIARTLPPSSATCSARLRTILGGSPFSGKTPHPSPAIDQPPPILAGRPFHAQDPEVRGHLATMLGVVLDHLLLHTKAEHRRQASLGD